MSRHSFLGRPPAWFWEVAAASLILLWRVLCYPAENLPFDWIVLISVYWIFTVRARHSRAWQVVTILLILWLFGIYAYRQIPLTIDALRFAL